MKTPAKPKPLRTRSVLDTALMNVLNHRRNLSAFVKAVIQAMESIPLRESAVPAYRKAWAKFCDRVARGDKHQDSLPNCLDRRTWKGRWTITNDDLEFLRDVAMWVGRHDPQEHTMAEVFWSQMLCGRAHKKRMWQAWQRFQTTGLTHEHLTLLAHKRWYQNCWRGHGESIYMDGKHPWGDSFIELSIYQKAGWELPRNQAGEVEMTAAQEERAWNLFDELPFAIPHAALNAKQMEIGPLVIGYRQNGKIWLQHQDGEGMMTESAKLEKHLLAFWNKEF